MVRIIKKHVQRVEGVVFGNGRKLEVTMKPNEFCDFAVTDPQGDAPLHIANTNNGTVNVNKRKIEIEITGEFSKMVKVELNFESMHGSPLAADITDELIDDEPPNVTPDIDDHDTSTSSSSSDSTSSTNSWPVHSDSSISGIQPFPAVEPDTIEEELENAIAESGLELEPLEAPTFDLVDMLAQCKTNYQTAVPVPVPADEWRNNQDWLHSEDWKQLCAKLEYFFQDDEKLTKDDNPALAEKLEGQFDLDL